MSITEGIWRRDWKSNFWGHEKCNNNIHVRKAMKKMLICIRANMAVVTFGQHHVAVNIMMELVKWDLYCIHCTNHQLEPRIKESFKRYVYDSLLYLGFSKLLNQG